MQRCLKLAGEGAGSVAPNPMVGAVLVCDDIIIGEGYHKRYGEAHAEVNCILSVQDHHQHLIEKSTLYVSLEPCNHCGKTPPCTDFILKYKIPKVIIACTDPFKKVNGSGIKRLQSAGIEVVQNVLEKEATDLNKRFFTFHARSRPYIILKWAQSNNSCIAANNNQAVKISNEITNRLVHKWRSEEAAIMIGTNTALNDNPSLTTRLWTGKNPVRIVIDKDLKLSLSLKVFDNNAHTIILNSRKNEEIDRNIYFKYSNDEDVVKKVMGILFQRNLTSLIVEGGAKLLQSFIDKDLWDEARIITNKELYIENGFGAPKLKDAFFIKREVVVSDDICYYRR